MLFVYMGCTGGGKTLSSIQDYLLPQLSKGRAIYSNIAGLDPMRIAARLNKTTSEVNKLLVRFTLTFKDSVADEKKVFKREDDDGLIHYSNAEGFGALIEDIKPIKDAVLILDECHEYLSPHSWRDLDSFLKYVSMTRHYFQDVVLITQHVKDIWEPICNRVHETHVFERGSLGFKTVYKEFVYRGWNVFVSESYTKNRMDDKTIYPLYKSHEGEGVEHIGYMSIWRNKKLVAMIALCFILFSYSAHSFFVRGLFGDIGRKSFSPSSSSADSSARRFDLKDNIIYVKYVVCSSFSCTATRPDGTTFTLPLDYESGRYPITIRRLPNASSSFSSFVPGSGSLPGVQN